ncbi:hypothetical protein I7I48_09879 [Histoplasma ohiense]|nr:hypothetical protein I7I48_09879 [Histoplasma ohiense (nom. inval.)]
MRINNCHHLHKLHFHNLNNFDYLGHSLITRLGFPDNASLRINWKNLHHLLVKLVICRSL